ncbi:uncharacterized protein LOC120333274 [Styela clava]
MFDGYEEKTYRKVVIAFLTVTLFNIVLDIIAFGSTGWMVRSVRALNNTNETTIRYQSGIFVACGPDSCANMILNEGAMVAAAMLIMGMITRCSCFILALLTMLKQIQANPQTAKLSFISGIFNVITVGWFGAYLLHTHAFEHGVSFGYSFALTCVVAILSIGISFLLGWERRHE